MKEKKLNNIKGLVVFLTLACLFALFTIDADIYLFPFSIKFIMLSALYAAVWVFSRRKLYSISNMNKSAILATCLSMAIGVAFFINGIFMGITGYICYGVLYTFMVPLFIITDIDEKTVIDRMLNVTVIFNILTIIASFVLVPLKTDAQYCSIFGNANMLGIFMSVFIIAVLIKILKEKNFRYLVLFAADIVFILLSESRTTMLTFAAVFALFVIYGFEKGVRLNKDILLKSIAVVVMALIMWNLSVFMLSKVTPALIDGVQSSVTFDKDDKDSDRSKHLLGKISKGISDEERFTSGRADIWKAFLGDIEFAGHETETIVFYTELDGKLERDAHNSVLQLAYTAGILPGIALLAMFVAGGIHIIRFLFGIRKNQYDEYNMFVVMIFTAYCINSMLTAMYNFQHSIMSFMFWMIGIRLFDINVKKDGE